MASINYREREIPIKLTYGMSMLKFPDLGLNIHSVFEEGNTVVQTIMLNDDIMVKIWYSYIKEATGDTFEDALDNLTPEIMRKFREDFWTTVVNFMPLPAKDALQEMWIAAKKHLSSQAKSLGSSSFALSEGQE